ncbi:hypothetical protein ACP4OV_013021 [Aristida adscensionis]
MASGCWRLSSLVVVALAVLLTVVAATSADTGTMSQHRRKLVEATDNMPLSADVFKLPPGYNPVQQVHITLGDQTGTSMIVSWVTGSEFPGGIRVKYGRVPEKQEFVARSTYKKYTYNNTYTSGFIHTCTLINLLPKTKYYYTIGFGILQTKRTFSFTTPPAPGPDVPFKFGIIGDLGQTFESNNTLSRYQASGGGAVLYLGDLSYADYWDTNNQTCWDTWGRLVERSAAYQPWLWTVGNHEEEFDPKTGETFKPFTHRFPTPYLAAGSTQPFWYSVKVASAHVVVLSSYSDYGEGSPQWAWLKAELRRVDRRTTPWLVVLMHAPWYNSNHAHQGETEGEDMRAEFEGWLVGAKADLVLAGHVHAYERFFPVFDGRRNSGAPVYINVGDGGNIEGIADRWNARPSFSAFRSSVSFGHGTLEIMNRTHAFFAWHPNRNDAKGDSVWLTNRYWTKTK